jgi:hypothetical protein
MVFAFGNFGFDVDVDGSHASLIVLFDVSILEFDEGSDPDAA